MKTKQQKEGICRVYSILQPESGSIFWKNQDAGYLSPKTQLPVVAFNNLKGYNPILEEENLTLENIRPIDLLVCSTEKSLLYNFLTVLIFSLQNIL